MTLKIEPCRTMCKKFINLFLLKVKNLRFYEFKNLFFCTILVDPEPILSHMIALRSFSKSASNEFSLFENFHLGSYGIGI
jgi:hypothetical protein